MPINRLKQYLDSQGVKYVSLTHSRAYTAQEVAASAHVRGKEMAKTVVFKIDNRLAMAVLPAPMKVDVGLLREISGARVVELATEEDFRGLFPECELGAMPPFGNLYDMEVYVEERLTEDEEIVFNACSHTELIRLAYHDYERLVKPKVAQLSVA